MTGVKLTGDTMKMIAAMQPELVRWMNKSTKTNQQETDAPINTLNEPNRNKWPPTSKKAIDQ